MPTFDTPEPISVTLDLVVGDIRIVSGDRTDTAVEVRPSDASRQSDVTAAEQTRVECAGGRLLVKAPRGWRQYTFRDGGESIDVQIELPAGSHVRGEAAVAALRCTGRLGECRFKTSIGEIRLDQAGPVQLSTGGGDISVDRAVGHAEIATGSGAVRIGEVDGTGVIKNSNGDSWIGEITGDLRMNAANGKISVDQAQATVEAKTANGDVRLGSRAVRSSSKPASARSKSESATASLPGWISHAVRQRVQRPGLRRASRTWRRRGGGTRPHRLRRRHHPPLPTPIRKPSGNRGGGGGMTTTTFRSALKATGLRKSFGDKVALDGIDLDVPEGEIFSLLGPNGAGRPPRSRSFRHSSALTRARCRSPASI